MHWPKTCATHFHEGLYNHRVGYMQLLESRAFGFVKMSGPKLLSTVPWDLIHTGIGSKNIKTKREQCTINKSFSQNVKPSSCLW